MTFSKGQPVCWSTAPSVIHTGRVVAVTATHVSVRSESGTLWQLSVSDAERLLREVERNARGSSLPAGASEVA